MIQMTQIKPEDIKRVKGMGFLHNKGTDRFNARIITRHGKITAAQTACIAKAAEEFGNGEVTFTSRMTVELAGVPYDKITPLQEFLAQEGLETGGTGAKVRPVVSCKGTTCQYGRLDSFALSEKIHYRFFKGYQDIKLPHKFKIAVGGCPNNCVKPDLNDVGIVGQLIPVFDPEQCRGCKKCAVVDACPINVCEVKDGILHRDWEKCNNCGRCVDKCYFGANNKGIPGYRIYIGGRWGKQFARGTSLDKIFTSEEEALNVVEKALLLFKDQGLPGERFATTIERLGFENVQQQLFSDDLLARKAEILNKE